MRIRAAMYFFISTMFLSCLLSPNPHQSSFSQIRQEYPLNLSISVSGGKETNKDSPSNGE